jgi:hypothetical protein
LWYIEQNYTPEELHPIYGNFPTFKFYGSTTSDDYDYDNNVNAQQQQQQQQQTWIIGDSYI